MPAYGQSGVQSLLVEGGAKVINSLLAAGVADRPIVLGPPTIVSAGAEAVGDLGIAIVASWLRLINRSLNVMADDLLIAWDVNSGGAAARADDRPISSAGRLRGPG